jgi:hypothetical protein
MIFCLTPPSSVSKLSLFLSIPACRRSSLLTGEGEGVLDKAWSSINYSNLFGFTYQAVACGRTYLYSFSSSKLQVLQSVMYYGDYNKNVQYRRLRSSCILDLHQLVCSREHHSVVPLSTLCSGFLSPESENPIQSTEKYLTDMPIVFHI